MAERSLIQRDSMLQSRIKFGPWEWTGDMLVVGPGSERSLWFAGIGLDSIRYARNPGYEKQEGLTAMCGDETPFAGGGGSDVGLRPPPAPR